MGIKITLKSDHYSGLFQDIRNRLIEEIEKQAERIILSPEHNYEITTQIPYNNEPGSPEIFQQYIYAVNKKINYSLCTFLLFV